MAAGESHYDVIVCGAGVIGSATALNLAKRGKKVLLLEQFDFLHRRGSSHGESRIIRKTYPEEFYTNMMFRAFDEWDRLQAEAGTDCITWTGGIDMAPDGNPDITSLIASCRRSKVPHQVLDSEGIRERFPQFTNVPDAYTGVYCPEAGVVNATKAVGLMQTLASKHGAVLKDWARVTDVRPRGEGPGSGVAVDVRLGQMMQKTEAAAVTTFTADKAIVAAGAWARKLVQKSTATKGVLLAAQPIKTTVAYWQCDQPAVFDARAGMPVFIDYALSIYGLPCREFPGLLKVCYHGGPDCEPDTRDFEPGTEALADIVTPFVRERLHGVSGRPTHTETCMYTMTPDHHFIIDTAPSNADVVIGAGFSGHGFKLAPLVGILLADLALGEVSVPGTEMSHFSISRDGIMLADGTQEALTHDGVGLSKSSKL